MTQTEATMGAENSSRRGWYTQSASATLEGGMRFAGETGEHRVGLDVPEEYGGGAAPQPMQLLLLSLAGCTAMDVLSILHKKSQQIAGLQVEARGRQAQRHPRVFDRVEVLYRVHGQGVDPGTVERAIELSRDRYCPVIATMRPAAEVLTSYEVEEETPAGTGTWEKGG